MIRNKTMVVAVAVLVAMAAIPFGAVATLAADGAQTDESNESAENASVAPGERLAGVVGVQHAEVDGEVSDRAYGLQLANASSDEEKAAIVSERLEEVEDRLADHEQRLEELRAQREAGEISEGAYRGKVASTNAERENTERMTNRSNETAAELPAETLEENGVNASAIQTLRDRADELGGQEVAEIARSIAGNSDGHPVFGDERPGAPGNGSDDRPAGPDNESDDRSADDESTEENASDDRSTDDESTADGDGERDESDDQDDSDGDR